MASVQWQMADTELKFHIDDYLYRWSYQKATYYGIQSTINLKYIHYITSKCTTNCFQEWNHANYFANLKSAPDQPSVPKDHLGEDWSWYYWWSTIEYGWHTYGYVFFTCVTIRAVHIDIVHDPIQYSFILAFWIFISHLYHTQCFLI